MGKMNTQNKLMESPLNLYNLNYLKKLLNSYRPNKQNILQSPDKSKLKHAKHELKINDNITDKYISHERTRIINKEIEKRRGKTPTNQKSRTDSLNLLRQKYVRMNHILNSQKFSGTINNSNSKKIDGFLLDSKPLIEKMSMDYLSNIYESSLKKI